MTEGGGEYQASQASSGAADVFISYSSTDVSIGLAVCGALESEGVTCWIAPRDVVPGELYADSIVRAIDAAKVVVLVLSQHAAASPHVVREIERATSKRRPVVALRTDLAAMPPSLEYFLNASHWLDANASGVTATLPKLTEAVKRLIAPRTVVALKMPGSSRVSMPGDLISQLNSGAPSAASTAGSVARLIRTRFYLAALALLVVAAIAAVWIRHSDARKSVLVMGAPLNMVAVLPFKNLSPDRRDDFVILGLSEMILNRLASVPTLRVVARTSSFALRDQAIGAHEIGQKLDTRYLVEGSVQHVGNVLRVTAQVVDALSGRQFNAMHSDKPLDQLFDLEDEIADAVTASLAVHAGDARKFRPEQARNAKMAAYLEYLQGRVFMGHWKTSDYDAAVIHFKHAIEIDPQFAAAYSSMAIAQDRAASGRRRDDTEEKQQSERLIDKALSLDDGLGEAYIARATLNSDRDPAASEADYRKGLELSPSDGTGYTDFAEALLSWNRRAEAEQVLQRAITIDPLSPRPIYLKFFIVTLAPMNAQVEKQAEEVLQNVLALDPSFTNALARLAELRAVYFGAFAEAAALAERILKNDPEASFIREDLMLYYFGAADPGAAKNVIGESSWYGQLCLASYAGDWSRAADLEFHRPAQLRDVDYDYLPIFAIQWYGHQTKQYDGAIAFLRDKYRLPETGGFDVQFDAALSVAILTQEKGDEPAAKRLAEAALSYLDSHPAQPASSMTSPLLNHAKAHLLLGQNDLALDEMSRSIHEFGGRIPYGWTLVADPLWDPVRSSTRFTAVAASYREQTAEQHGLIMEMRRKGEIPER